MSERVSKAQVERRAEAANRALALRRPGTVVVVESRYGYTAVDLYGAQGSIRTLTTGTKREAWEYLGALLEGLWLAGQPAEEAQP